VHGQPTLSRRLERVHGVIARRVKDGDADLAVVVNGRMPHDRLEFELWGRERKVLGESHSSFEDGSIVERVRWPARPS
jgi:hypothetical protein